MSSWFTEIAGKAENFLNKMDQTAAEVLTGDAASPPSTKITSGASSESRSLLSSQAELKSENAAVIPHLVTFQPKYSEKSPVVVKHSRDSSFSSSFSNISSRDLQSGNNQTSNNSNNHLRNESSGVNRREEDEKMMDFLNNSSDGTLRSDGKSGRGSDEEINSNASIEVVSVSSDEDKISGKNTPLIESDVLSMTSHTNRNSCLDPRHSKLEEEINSLSREISILNKRNVDSETEVKRLQKRIEKWQQQLTTSDTVIRELQSREVDLKNTLEARDASISIIKVRLQESESEVKSKNEILDRMRGELETLIQERDEHKNRFGSDVESLRSRISDLEQELLRQKESFNQMQQESMNRLGIFEESQKQLVDEMSSIQRDLRSERNTRKELERQIKMAKSNYDSLQQEFEEYKTKAQHTLSQKEELIRSLQKKHSDGDEGIADTSDFQSDYEESNRSTLVLQQQCDSLILEVNDLRTKNESLKHELKRIKEEEMEHLQSELSSASSQADEEKRARQDLEHMLQQTQEELRYVKHDLQMTKSNLSIRVRDKDQEIDTLRKQLISKKSSASADSLLEMESRIKSLAESLIEKQMLVEKLSSERQSLALQLERSDARLRNALDSSTPAGSVSIGMGHSTSSSSSLINRSNGFRPLAEDSPQDSHVTRRVKRVYGQLDAFSIRLGQFLRIYPSARAILIFYILLLHLWIFFLLFTYRPEIHELDP